MICIVTIQICFQFAPQSDDDWSTNWSRFSIYLHRTCYLISLCRELICSSFRKRIQIFKTRFEFKFKQRKLNLHHHHNMDGSHQVIYRSLQKKDVKNALSLFFSQFAKIRYFTFVDWLLGAKTNSRQITHSKWCFWKCFRIQTKCIPINVTKISILYLLFFALNVNKGCAPTFCNFSATFLKSVEKRFLAYIYICLFLYLPIFIFAYLPFTYNNSRLSLFAYFLYLQ